MRWWPLIVAIGTAGCPQIGNELEEEVGSWNDHSFTLSATRTRLVVGGYTDVYLHDACTPSDNEECTNDTFTITGIMHSGQVQGAGTTQLRVTALREAGTGSVTVTATSPTGSVPTSASLGFEVLSPEAAVLRHYCPVGLEHPTSRLVAPDEEARVFWSFLLDGEQVSGDSGINYVDAPALTFISQNGASALYRTPATPGIVTVRSTLGPSQFEYDVYDPATATLSTLVGGESSRHDGIELGFRLRVGGELTCTDPSGKHATSLTPDVCVIRPVDSPLLTTAIVDDVRVNVAPLGSGSCSVELAMPALGLSATHTFDVTPFPPENRIWSRTCSPAQGTKCGVMCPGDWTDDNGCRWVPDTQQPLECSTDPAQLRCRYRSYLSPACESTTTRLDESACWSE